MGPRLLAFDINGTLLDTGALDVNFQQAFGSTSVRREWFMEMIQMATTSAIAGYFDEFSLFIRRPQRKRRVVLATRLLKLVAMA